VKKKKKERKVISIFFSNKEDRYTNVHKKLHKKLKK
jgi:hypothetical protein